MTADEDRATAYLREQARIEKARKDAAKALLAPPAPAKAVKDAWEPLRDVLAQQKAAGGNP